LAAERKTPAARVPDDPKAARKLLEAVLERHPQLRSALSVAAGDRR